MSGYHALQMTSLHCSMNRSARVARARVVFAQWRKIDQIAYTSLLCEMAASERHLMQ